MRKSLFWKIFGGYLIIIAVFGAVLLGLSFKTIRTAYVEDQVLHLKGLNEVLMARVMTVLKDEGPENLEPFIKDIGKRTKVRITVIRPDGTVLADSEEVPERMDSHQYRPEVFQALQGQTGRSVRRSSTVRADMLYIGFPMFEEGRVTGVLRLSMFMKDIDALLYSLQRRMFQTAAAILALVLLVMIVFSRSISRPIREFITTSRRVAGGNFDAKVSLGHRGEMGDFARSFNAMTGDLKTMFLETRRRTEELDSILSAIHDGLLVIDAKDEVVLSNEAFRGIVQDLPPGRRFYWEVLRSPSFAELVREARESRTNRTREVRIKDGQFLCNAVFLPMQERLVVTLNDLSEARNVERMKKDFVLNVSHELRTPLTAIKGFAETLEGRLEGEDKGFASIIHRNTDRLIGIVQDLLSLAQLEEKGASIEIEKTDLRLLTENVLKLFGNRAADKGVRLELNAEAGLLPFEGDSFQLEQMLINLIDNAVKHTEKGIVAVSLKMKDRDIVIDVRDTGIGIPEEHLTHIFERFYVVDKSRSRKLGGTGLGLSIVKHIVLAHRGKISVRSRLGEGTTFTVELPLR
ncbi:HAMP domain-containing protein [bacterium]|nr:MAG: HAMP domain-containing protein [bacterium]